MLVFSHVSSSQKVQIRFDFRVTNWSLNKRNKLETGEMQKEKQRTAVNDIRWQGQAGPRLMLICPLTKQSGKWPARDVTKASVLCWCCVGAVFDVDRGDPSGRSSCGSICMPHCSLWKDIRF